MHRLAHHLRRVVAIDLRDRPDHVIIGGEIEGEDAAVDRLEGVVDLIGIFLGTGRLRGSAAAEHQGERHEGCP